MMENVWDLSGLSSCLCFMVFSCFSQGFQASHVKTLLQLLCSHFIHLFSYSCFHSITIVSVYNSHLFLPAVLYYLLHIYVGEVWTTVSAEGSAQSFHSLTSATMISPQISYDLKFDLCSKVYSLLVTSVGCTCQRHLHLNVDSCTNECYLWSTNDGSTCNVQSGVPKLKVILFQMIYSMTVQSW